MNSLNIIEGQMGTGGKEGVGARSDKAGRGQGGGGAGGRIL